MRSQSAQAKLADKMQPSRPDPLMLDTELETLPGSLELPDSDDTPVDNELQNHVPNLLYRILLDLWADRQDWFFAVDMGIYDTQGQRTRTPIVPDAFLSLGVARRKDPQGRLSYVIAEEKGKIPILAIECVSHTAGGEYDRKLAKYADLGIRYYAIYNPHYWRRDQHEPFEIYELKEGSYERLAGNPVWLAAVGLGLGMEERETDGWRQAWLYWYDPKGERYLVPEEQRNQERILREQAIQQVDQERILKQQAIQQADQERILKEQATQRADQADQRAEVLAQCLRELGIDPDSVRF